MRKTKSESTVGKTKAESLAGREVSLASGGPPMTVVADYSAAAGKPRTLQCVYFTPDGCLLSETIPPPAPCCW